MPRLSAGHVVQEQVALLDVFPTVLQLSQQNPTPDSLTKNTHFGRSLVPQLMGGAGDAQRVVYAEAGLWGTRQEHSGRGEVEKVLVSVQNARCFKACKRCTEHRRIAVRACSNAVMRTDPHPQTLACCP